MADSELPQVKIACECPGHPHEQDILYFRPKPDLAMGLAAQSALAQASGFRGDGESAFLGALARHGVVEWTCRDEDGPIRVSPQTVVERIGWGIDAIAVVEKARELYYKQVLDPLAVAKSDSEPPTPEAPSTSPSLASSPPSPTSPLPSSHSAAAVGKQSATIGA